MKIGIQTDRILMVKNSSANSVENTGLSNNAAYPTLEQYMIGLSRFNNCNVPQPTKSRAYHKSLEHVESCQWILFTFQKFQLANKIVVIIRIANANANTNVSKTQTERETQVYGTGKNFQSN